MSDISQDEVKQEEQVGILSDIAPSASQMSDKMPPQAPPAAPFYEPPAWMQSELHTAEMSDSSAVQPATRRITVRLPTADLTDLDARANALNASRSDYLRTLIALPVTLDLTSIRRATPGTESLTRPLGPDLAITQPASQTNSLVVQAITDSMLESISNEVRAIGVNYNQSVRALNRILKKYGNHRALSQDERVEITELYERLSKQNKAIYDRLKTLAADVESLSETPSVNLTAIGLSQSVTPINKNETDRRRRIRGKKHGQARPDRIEEEDNS